MAQSKLTDCTFEKKH